MDNVSISLLERSCDCLAWCLARRVCDIDNGLYYLLAKWRFIFFLPNLVKSISLVCFKVLFFFPAYWKMSAPTRARKWECFNLPPLVWDSFSSVYSVVPTWGGLGKDARKASCHLLLCRETRHYLGSRGDLSEAFLSRLQMLATSNKDQHSPSFPSCRSRLNIWGCLFMCSHTLKNGRFMYLIRATEQCDLVPSEV